MRDRSLITWDQVIRKDMRIKEVDVSLNIDKNEWREKIHVNNTRGNIDVVEIKT